MKTNQNGVIWQAHMQTTWTLHFWGLCHHWATAFPLWESCSLEKYYFKAYDKAVTEELFKKKNYLCD